MTDAAGINNYKIIKIICLFDFQLLSDFFGVEDNYIIMYKFNRHSNLVSAS